MRENHSKVQLGVKYPKHQFDPQDLLHFVETSNFTTTWKDLGLDDEDDLTALQLSIMLDPAGPPIIGGTGGLRKLRFSPRAWQSGKSGALRICYAYFEEPGIVLLVIVYSKSTQDNLTDTEKKACKTYIQEIEHYLSTRPVRIKTP